MFFHRASLPWRASDDMCDYAVYTPQEDVPFVLFDSSGDLTARLFTHMMAGAGCGQYEDRLMAYLAYRQGLGHVYHVMDQAPAGTSFCYGYEHGEGRGRVVRINAMQHAYRLGAGVFNTWLRGDQDHGDGQLWPVYLHPQAIYLATSGYQRFWSTLSSSMRAVEEGIEIIKRGMDDLRVALFLAQSLARESLTVGYAYRDT